MRLCAFALKVFLVCGVFHTAAAQGQQATYTPPYGGPQATYDAYARGEAQRQQDIGRMIDRIDQIRWYRGLPPRGADLFIDRYPPSLSYAYATGRLGILGASSPRYIFREEDIFTPWPYVPGDIWGFADDYTVPQSIGQRQFQTGPNRWESHPVYRDPPPPLRRSTGSGPREF
jgi:hypothetical protein